MNETNKYLRVLNIFEDGLGQQFRNHPVLRAFDALPDSAVIDILLQKRYLSQGFTSPHEDVLPKLGSPHACDAILWILEEEQKPRPHPQLLDEDLKTMGVSLTVIPEETSCTREIRNSLHQMLRKAEDTYLLQERSPQQYDSYALAFLRVFGEVLVGEEYARLCPELERRFGLTEERSVFYWPHYRHDKKTQPLGQGNEEGNHGESLGKVLAKLVAQMPPFTVSRFTAAAYGMLNGYSLRLEFYDQFLPRQEH